MGIDQDGAAFLSAAQRTGVIFTKTCTIGRQRLTTSDAAPDGSDPADPFFAALGAERVDSLDYSGYEGATITHDLNHPDAPAGADRSYTAVVDGGTLEHVFNVPNALATMMRMVAPMGHLILINPADGHMGHGLYQFSPEFFFRALSEENGFEVELCLLKEQGPRRPWFAATDPARVGRRVEPRTRSGAYLYVAARRVQPDRPIFDPPPSQSDYANAWTNGSPTGGMIVGLGRRLPPRVQRELRAGWEIARRRVGPRGSGLSKVDIHHLGAPDPSMLRAAGESPPSDAGAG